MDDPNVTYKSAFAELREKLGRTPTATECLPLHEAYKRGFGNGATEPTPDSRRDVRPGNGQANNGRGNVADSTPTTSLAAVQGGELTEVGAREGEEEWLALDVCACVEESDCPHVWEPVTNPGAGATREEGGSEPEAAENKPEPPERRYTAGRGPGGGVMATCRACGREWERPVKAGRPASKCEECR